MSSVESIAAVDGNPVSAPSQVDVQAAPPELTVEEKKQHHQDVIEALKLRYDAMKHLTTLCTGSVLVLLAMPEKFRECPSSLIALCFCSLTVSIIACLFMMFSIPIRIAHGKTYYTGAQQTGIKIMFYLAFLGFTFAIINLMLFMWSAAPK